AGPDGDGHIHQPPESGEIDPVERRIHDLGYGVRLCGAATYVRYQYMYTIRVLFYISMAAADEVTAVAITVDIAAGGGTVAPVDDSAAVKDEARVGEAGHHTLELPAFHGLHRNAVGGQRAVRDLRN